MRDNEIRITLWVESPRGDDRFGTNLNTGAIISDHDAKTQGVPFQHGIPQNLIQQAVETQLKQDKWVCIEKKDGSTELLTKKDLPKLYPAPVVKVEDETEEEEEGEEEQEEPTEETPKPKGEDWKDAFNLNNAKPKPAPTTSNGKCNSKPKEIWESKFENIKSATATHKGKGG